MNGIDWLICRFLVLASLEPPQLLPRPWLVTPLMATQFMAMPQTLLDQLWSLAGQRLLRRQPTWVTSPTTAPLTLLAPATWTRPTATPSLTEPMATSWSRTTTTCHTIMQDPRRLPSVDLPHKNPIQIFNILCWKQGGLNLWVHSWNLVHLKSVFESLRTFNLEILKTYCFDFKMGIFCCQLLWKINYLNQLLCLTSWRYWNQFLRCHCIVVRVVALS